MESSCGGRELSKKQISDADLEDDAGVRPKSKIQKLHHDDCGDEKDDTVEQTSKPDDASTIRFFHLVPDELLPIILKNVDLEAKVRAVPLVCKKWYTVWQSESTLWTTMDFIPWETRRRSFNPASILLNLMPRARCSLRELHVQFMDSANLSDLLDRVGPQLERLTVISSDLCTIWAVENASKLKNVKYLDLPQCYFLTERGIRALCRHCTSLTYLRVPPKGLYTRFDKREGSNVEFSRLYVPGKGSLDELTEDESTRVLRPH